MVASRWADEEEDAAIDAQRKKEKEEKKRAKAEKARKQEEAARRQQEEQDQQQRHDSDRPNKRRRLSTETDTPDKSAPRKLLRFTTPTWAPTRSIDNFERLNHIEEGSYGFVSRAKETATGEIVAIKKLKQDAASSAYGFPVTALREIQTLNAARGHRHIVDLREVVTGKEVLGEKGEVFLVMDFLEHDLKTLMEGMEEPFLPSEVKTLLLQLGSAVDFLHDRWILHVRPSTSSFMTILMLTWSPTSSEISKHQTSS